MSLVELLDEWTWHYDPVQSLYTVTHSSGCWFRMSGAFNSLQDSVIAAAVEALADAVDAGLQGGLCLEFTVWNGAEATCVARQERARRTG